MPLAKSAPKEAEQTQAPEHPQPTSISPIQEGIHIEFYRYFDINPINTTDSDKLEKVYKWANREGEISKALRKTRQLEIQLGAPAVGETRLNKIYNWVRLSEHIDNLRGEMKDELTTITTKSKSEISRIKESHLPELEKLEQDIAEKKEKLRNAIRYYKTNLTNQARQVKERYERELDKLKIMRSAFKGEKK